MKGFGIALLLILLTIFLGYFGINKYFESIAVEKIRNLSEIKNILKYKKKFDIWNKVLILESEEEMVKIYFGENWSIKEVQIKKKEKFCGISTFGYCERDSDCIISGCSNQLCQSKFEGRKFTTCEWKECYDYRKYNYVCACVNNKCQWKKT